MIKIIRKKLLASILSIAMLISFIPAMTLTVNATEPEPYTAEVNVVKELRVLELSGLTTISDDVYVQGYTQPSDGINTAKLYYVSPEIDITANEIEYYSNTDNDPSDLVSDDNDVIYFKADQPGRYNFDIRILNYSGTDVIRTITVEVSGGDTEAPTVSSINRNSPATETTNADSVIFRVTFNEPVTGVDTTDFTLTTTGNASGTVNSVTASSDAVYDVTVNSITGSGTLRLDLNDNETGIADVGGTAIAAGHTIGQTYTIDKTAVESPQETEYSTDGGDTWTQGSFSDAITALNNSTDGGTIRLLSDVTLDAGVVIKNNITIISSGARTIKRGANLTAYHDMLYIRDNSTLTLGTEDGMGEGNTLTIDGGAIWSGGVEDSILKRSTNNIGLSCSAGLVWADSENSTFKMYDGVILQNNDNRHESNGGTVYVGRVGYAYQATFEMHGGEIKNVHSNYMVGGVRIIGSKATFIMGETAKITGVSGGVQGVSNTTGPVHNNGSFTMNGGIISGNSNVGNSIVDNTYGNLTMNGGTISGNKTIKNNGEGLNSGGAYGVSNPYGTLIIKGGEISGNQIIHDYGAGVYLYNGEFKIQGNTIIKDNILGTSTDSNIYITDSAVIEVDGPLNGAAGNIGITGSQGIVLYNKTVVTGYDDNKGDNTLPVPFFSDDPTLQLSSNGSGGIKLGRAPTPEYKPTASFNASTMTLSNVSNGMKYSVDGGDSWIDITTTSVVISNVTAAQDIKIYKVGNGTTTVDSEIQTIDVTQAATPSAYINYDTEKLSGLEVSISYKINGNSIDSNAAGEIHIDGQWFGGNISIVKPGNNTTTIDSTAQSLNIPARSIMTSPSPETGSGKITNVTTAMEFSQDNTTWRDITDVEAANGISGLNAGTYYVRIKATAESFASLVTTLTIGTDKIPVTAVSISGTAKVGLTLNATVEPSNATVNYQWQVNETDVGTNAATYIVQAEDIGKTITVTATGTGSYSGTVTSNQTVPTMTTLEKNITIGTTAPVRDAAVADGTNTPPTGATGATVTWSSDDGANYASASGTFAAATTYKTKYVYTANAGYEFDSAITGNDITVTNIGSGTKAVQLTNENKTLTITVTWPTTAANPDAEPIQVTVLTRVGLQAAFDNASSGDTLQLTGSISFGQPGVEIIGKDITLDLNGQTITYDSSGFVITLKNNASLTVVDSGTGGAIISTHDGSFGSSTIIYNTGTGTVNISGGSLRTGGPNNHTIINNGGGAVNVSGNGKVSTTGNSSYAISSNGKVTVSENATVSSSVNRGTAISGIGTFEITGGTVSSTNTALNIAATGVANISGGTVSATGTIYSHAIHNEGIVNISGTAIVTADGSFYGGTINNASNACEVNISGGTVSATGSRCAIYSSQYTEGAIISVSGGIVSAKSNSAIVNEGTGTVNVSGGMVASDNVQTINNSGAGAVTVSGGSIRSIFKGNGTLTNGQTTPAAVVLYTLDLGSQNANSAVTSLTTTTPLGYDYGMKDVKTDANGRLYVWLPAWKTHVSAVVGGQTIITPTTFTADEQAVVAAKDAIVNGTVDVAYDADQTAKTAAVQTYVNTFLTGDAAGVTAEVTYDSGNNYNVTISKGGANYTKTITMTINVGVNPDIATVNAGKTAAEGASYADMNQGAATDEDAIVNAIKDVAEAAIDDTSVNVTINKISYTAPIAGTSENPSGTNGSYVFTVTVSKGGQTQITDEKTITITATAFTGDGANYYSGAPAGISSEPRTYNIINETQLRDLAETVNNGTSYQYTTFVLQNDIALSDGDWTPIAIDNTPSFQGTFDGNNKKITGIKIGSADTPDTTLFNVGLFGHVGANGTIKNIGVEAEIYTKNDALATGGLVGRNKGTIINSYVTGNIAVEKRDIYIGGGIHGGGLVGINEGTITNSYAKANVTGVSSDTLGGLVGSHSGTSITNSYATGNVTCIESVPYVGGLVGRILNDINVITNSYWNNDATQMVNGSEPNPKKGVGSGASDGVTSMESDDMKADSFVETLNANLDTLADTALYKWQVKASDYPTFSNTLWSVPATTTIGKAITISTIAPVTAASITDGTCTQPAGASGPAIAWSADNGLSWTASGKFAAGKVYKTKYVYTANTGYQFDSTIAAADISVTYLGSGTKNVALTNSNKTLTITVTWPSTMAEVVTINGTVRDNGGNPVTGATVTLTPGAGTPNPATTGNAGQYTINNVPKGNYSVTVTLPNGGGSFIKDVTVSGANINLQQPAALTYTVSGSIKDAADNSPISGATVTLTNTTNSTITYTTTTNINGNYTITGVPDGNYAVDVTKNGETYDDANTVITVSGSNVSGASGNISVTIPTYSVTYHGNGSDSSAVPEDSAKYKKGSYARVMGKGTLARNGYNFTAWNTASNGSGTSYKVNDALEINGNVTLYAQWKAIDSAQIPIFTYSNVRGTDTVTQPADANELYVTAEVNDGGNLSYQWYKSTSGTAAGAVAISSATNERYTPPADVVGTAYYYVVVTNTSTQSGVKPSTNTSGVKTVIVLGEPAASYTVSTNTLNNITLGNTSATQYQNYITNIIADTGYYLPDRITVTMGGRTLVDGIDYIYTKTSTGTGTVTVYNVTGEIAITASGDLIPATVYTISFNSNGADVPVGDISGNYGQTISLPTPTKAGFSFAGWYRDNGFTTAYVSTTMGKENITLYAKWQTITYDISGNVKDEDNANVNSASVKLMAGSRQVAQAATDIDGDFTISGVPAGKYNLVITKGDQKITLVITVLNSNLATGSVTLPRGKKNSVLEVKQDTPDIVVDKLNDFFNSEKFTQDDQNIVDAGGMVEIKLSIEIKDESGDNAAANADSIRTSAEGSGKAVGIFLNLTLSKIITPKDGAAEQPILIDELSDLLIIDIPLPAELQGKSGYVIYRYHGTEVQTITEDENEDGEYIEVSADRKSIKLHTKKFSTYAVGYTTPSTPPANNSDNKVPSTITIEPGEGGRINIGTDNKTVTITPDNGYAIADVMVDGKSIGSTEKYIFTDKDTHKISAVFVKKTALPYYNQDGRKVCIGFSAVEGNLYKYIAPPNVTVEFMENPKNFIDNTIAREKPSIDFVTEREIFLGTGQDRFSPNMNMTRSMLVAVLGRLYERSYGIISGTSSSTFTDVDVNVYYAKYVVWAYENGLVKGVGNNKFAPDEDVTREQMAVIMLNFAKLLNKADVTENPLAYTDSASISAYAIDGAKYCQETNIIVGRSGGNFAPQESATRAEVAAVIERFIKTIMK